jgi:hypothetical protein
MRDRFTRKALREAQRVLDEQPPLPPDEQAYNERRRAEMWATIDRVLASRGLTPARRDAPPTP